MSGRVSANARGVTSLAPVAALSLCLGLVLGVLLPPFHATDRTVAKVRPVVEPPESPATAAALDRLREALADYEAARFAERMDRDAR